MSSSANRYAVLIERIFFDHYAPGLGSFDFGRDELPRVAALLGISLPKNLGDILYSFRYRNPLPKAITQTAPQGTEWIIRLAGHGRYRFKLARISRIEPDEAILPVKVPNSTPEIILANAFDDEQALLAKIRYNRLVDLFLGITAHSLQNHLRTTVSDVGQIEIDEVYVGVDRRGRQFIVPVQAKVGRDQLGVVQTEQDIAFCAEKFPSLICRPLSVHALKDGRIAMFELTLNDDEIRILDQKHYLLVHSVEISTEDLALYGRNG